MWISTGQAVEKSWTDRAELLGIVHNFIRARKRGGQVWINRQKTGSSSTTYQLF